MDEIHIDADCDAKVKAMVAKGDTPFQIAEKIASAARADAPKVTGTYAGGIVAQKTPHGARVLAADQKSSWVEFGIPSHNQAPQFILRRAVDSLGLKFRKGHG